MKKHMYFIEKIKNSSITTQVIAGLLVLAIGSGAGWVIKKLIAPHEKEVIISNPISGSLVGYETKLEGSFSTKYKDSDLWLILQPVKTPRFYPADGPILKMKNGTWKGTIYFGSSETDAIGEEFVVFIASTNPNASKVFKDYHQKSIKTNLWEGLASLPNNTELHDSITLTKK